MTVVVQGWGAVVGWLEDGSVWVECGLDFRRWVTLGRIGRGGCVPDGCGGEAIAARRFGGDGAPDRGRRRYGRLISNQSSGKRRPAAQQRVSFCFSAVNPLNALHRGLEVWRFGSLRRQAAQYWCSALRSSFACYLAQRLTKCGEVKKGCDGGSNSEQVSAPLHRAS